ncbi:hypothetical protein ACFSKL_07985 [Belliella marina]|uniref:Uncharacterized protein n=1 Tax=Belliella marina TaxID=1644146 RepID=A0ABW4VN54_9BACT
MDTQRTQNIKLNNSLKDKRFPQSETLKVKKILRSLATLAATTLPKISFTAKNAMVRKEKSKKETKLCGLCEALMGLVVKSLTTRNTMNTQRTQKIKLNNSLKDKGSPQGEILKK